MPGNTLTVRATSTYDNTKYGEAIVSITNVPIDDTPPVISNTNITAVADIDSIAISWEKASDNATPQNELRYVVQWGTVASGTLGSYYGWYADMSSYTIKWLEPNTQYRITVIVSDLALNNNYYDTITVNTLSGTSIIPIEQNELKCYIANGELRVENAASVAGSKIEIIDILGHIVRTQSSSHNGITTIAVADLPKGIYMVRVGKYVKKIIIG
jgi:hypothetical protein